MKDDRFTNLEQDIIRSLGRILSSREMNDLKKTISSAMEQVDEVTTKTARRVEQASRRVQQHYTYPPKPPKEQKIPKANTTYSHNYPTTYRNLPVKGSVSSGFWLAGSICGIALGASMLSLGTVFSLIMGFGNAAISFISSAAVTAASIISTVFAGKSLGRIGRFKKYLKTLGGHPMYTIREISDKSGINEETVQKDLPKFLKAVSLPFAKTDEQKTCLILDKDTYQQ